MDERVVAVLGAMGSGKKGVCFSYTLTIDVGPVSPADLLYQVPVASTNAPGPDVSGMRLRGRVLLAEDTPELQQLFRKHISSTGADVLVVENGQRAVEEARKQDFDLILMDMQMPIMGGLEAVTILRASGYTGPIAALTADAMKEDQNRCMAAGCDAFLAKPVQRNVLVAMMSCYLPRAAAQAVAVSG